MLYGVADVDPVAENTARSYGLGPIARARYVVWPTVLPYLMTGIRLASAVALILAITAELIIGSPGLGYQIALTQAGGGPRDVRPHRRHRNDRRHHQPGHAPDRKASARLALLHPQRGRRMKTLKRTAYFVGLPLLLIIMWWALTLGPTNFYVPTPQKLGETFLKVWGGERLLTDFVPSVTRLFVGLVATIVLGVVLGVLIGSFRWLRSLTEPVLEFFRAVPPPVLVPLLMLLIGVNDQMKMVVIISGAIWPVLLNTVEGVRAVDEVLANTSRTYRINGFARLRYLVLPAASPQIMTGIRQCLSIGLILMVISEMFGSSSGLGFTIVLFQRGFAIPEMWSGIAVLGLIGIALSLIAKAVEGKVLRWYRGLKEVQRDS